MLKDLKPVLSSQRKAELILSKYWQNKSAIIWTIEQVHRAANERERVLTNAEARELLNEFVRNHNPQYGVKWQDLLELIDQSVAGKKMTRQELKEFVEQDRICVRRRKT